MGEHNGPTSSIQIIRGNWVVCRVAYDIKALWVPRPCQPPSPPSTNQICIKAMMTLMVYIILSFTYIRMHGPSYYLPSPPPLSLLLLLLLKKRE